MKQERKCVVPVPADSMEYRPAGYFGFDDAETEVLSRVKGGMRRRTLRGLLDAGRIGEMSPWLGQHELSADDRAMLGRMHPSLMGGEYLPRLREGEVEIARISIRSTTGDVQAVYAGRTGKRYAYRVVDEYEGECLAHPKTRTSVRPLTMGELIEFFLGSWSLYDCLECNYEDDLPGMLRFFEGESAFYPCFDSALRGLVSRRFSTAPDQPSENATESGQTNSSANA